MTMIEGLNSLNGAMGMLKAGAIDWWTNWSVPELSEPHLLFIASLATLIGLASRSFLLLAGAGGLAVAGMHLIATEAPETAPFLAAAIITSQLLVLAGVVTARRQVRRLRHAARTLEEQKRALQANLDREILWRTAAEDLSPGS
jgi:hypothetical protein